MLLRLSDSVFISHQLAGSNPELLDGRQQCYRCTSVANIVRPAAVWVRSFSWTVVMINVACADSFHRNVCVENEDAASELG